MSKKYDFSGWATKVDLQCSDGAVIKKDAFKVNDGTTVPLIWMHGHNDVNNVLGHALLENRPEGIYAYGTFNESESGKTAKLLVQNGDVEAMSIWANSLQRNGKDVVHGAIKEVSLVIAGANPGAFIDQVLAHSMGADDECQLWTGEYIEIYHSDVDEPEDAATDPELTPEPIVEPAANPEPTDPPAPEDPELTPEPPVEEPLEHTDKADPEPTPSDKTVSEVYESFTEEQKEVVLAMVGNALENSDGNNNNDDPEGGDDDMKQSIFNNKENTDNALVLSHAEQGEIIQLAKENRLKLSQALKTWASSHTDRLSHGIDGDNTDVLVHGFEQIEKLFPDYKDVYGGAPELLTRDQSWVAGVLDGAHKSPISRIRTRQTDIRKKGIRAKGYVKGTEKTKPEDAELLARTTEPQTIYRTDALERDDIIDITDFDVVAYQWTIMDMNIREELATAIMVGDGRTALDQYKIKEDKVRPIWTDADLYTIKAEVDIAAMTAELQGTETGKYFGKNFIYAEAIITAALHAREDYKGSGNLSFYCTPHLLNVMLLAKDRDGRRIYQSKADIAAALDVSDIRTVEQFEGLIRTTTDSKKKKLLGIFVNLNDYQIGATKGGELTKFNQFDIDFNQEKFLIETRVSGALTKVYSAITLEEDVTGVTNP